MTRFWTDVGLGIRTYFKSFRFIVKNRMMHFYLYPLLFIVIFSIGAAYGIDYLDSILTPWLNELIGVEPIPGDSWWDKTLNFIKSMSTYAMSFLIWAGLLFVYYKINKYLVLIIMSPVMALIAEKTDEVVTGQRFPFSWRQLMKDVWRGMLIAVRNFFLETAITVVLLVINGLITLFFAPLSVVTTPLVTVILFFVGAYYYGFATMDYTNERYRLSMGESVRAIRHHRGLAISNGSIFALWLFVPILGTYIGTVFAPVTCTVGATLALLEKRSKGEMPQYQLPERAERRNVE